MKKRMVSLMMAGVMAVSLAGCGGAKTETTTAETKAEETKADESQAEETSAEIGRASCRERV